MHYSTILSVALATLTFTPSVLTSAIPNPVGLAPARRAEAAEVSVFPFDEADAAYLEEAFQVIEDIPDSVLDDGDEAVKAWANAHKPNPQHAVRSELAPRQGLVQIAKCALAIVTAIAENAFPIAKLRRLRDLVKLLGGARAVAKVSKYPSSFYPRHSIARFYTCLNFEHLLNEAMLIIKLIRCC